MAIRVFAFAALGLLPLALLPSHERPETGPAPSHIGVQQGAPSQVKTENNEGFAVVGLCVRTNNARELGPHGAIPALWGRVMQEHLLDSIPSRADSNTMVVNSDYSSDQNGDYDYTLGARVLSTSAIPEGFVVKTIKPGRYAVLSSEKGAPATVVPALWQRIWKMTPQELGGARAFQTDFEVYAPSSDPQSITMQVHIGLKP